MHNTHREINGAKPTKDDVITFGGIMDPAATGLRSSDRLRAQPDVDLPELDRAMNLLHRRAARYDSGTTPIPMLSFVSIPSEVIAACKGF